MIGPFKGHQKPVRKGVYKREFHGQLLYSMWNGVAWMTLEYSPGRAKKSISLSWHQERPWYGMEKP